MHKPNKITTSKYTPLTFLPLNLYYQFTKYNNLFFLITLILLCVPEVSPFTPYMYMLAFVFIISISVIKDALEDRKRHMQDEIINGKEVIIVVRGDACEIHAYGSDIKSSESDKVNLDKTNENHMNDSVKDVNNTKSMTNINDELDLNTKPEQQDTNKVQVNCDDNKNTSNFNKDKLTNKPNNDADILSINSLDDSKKKEENFRVVIKRVEDIKCGDVVVIREHGEVPADVILIGSKGFNGECRKYCFIETSNLDGENNLKRKNVALSDEDCDCERKRSINMNRKKNIKQNLSHKNIYATNQGASFNSIATVNSVILRDNNDEDISLSKCDIKRLRKIKSFTVQETGELLNDIKCIITTNTSDVIQNDKNVLLKGSRLKNTVRVLGLVVSVGTNTKQSKNLAIQELGISLFEKRLNRSFAYIFIGYYILLTLLSILTSLFIKRDDIEYLYLNTYRSKYALYLTGTNYILFSFLIPISLFVTIEIARVFMSTYIKHDNSMKSDGVNTNCRNSNVLEDIGMIDHILTDKTGTLTNNEMTLKYIHLQGNDALIPSKNITLKNDDDKSKTDIENNKEQNNNKFETKDNNYNNSDSKHEINSLNKNDKVFNNGLTQNQKDIENENIKNLQIKNNTELTLNKDNLNKIRRRKQDNNSKTEYSKNKEIINKENITKKQLSQEDLFYLALLTCNSAERFNERYEGPSQDEICILEGIKNIGEIMQRKENTLRIKYKEKEIEVPILMCLDFTSKRQRMTIVTEIENKYYLFTKGSDAKVLKNIRDTKNIKQKINDNSEFRSLVVGYKELDEINYVKTKYDSIGLMHRNDKIEEIFKDLEKDLKYLGCTFVEDTLQEGIKDCINDFLKAGIKVWMVTGDKKETATSCGILCGIKPEGKVADKNKDTVENKSIDNKSNVKSTDNGNVRLNNNNNGKSTDNGNGKSTDNSNVITTDNGNVRLNNNSNAKSTDNKSNVKSTDNINAITTDNGNVKSTDNSNVITSDNSNAITTDNSNTKSTDNKINVKSNNINSNEQETFNNSESHSTLSSRGSSNSFYDEMNCDVLSAEEILKKLEKNEVLSGRAIIYRASPEQKSKIAKILVSKDNNVLAIGDGNNDVMMLQSSNIGVGIIGKEGTQASLSADFSVPSFYCLKKLLFVHGRYNYMRFSKLVVNSFYKNLLLIFTQFFYNFFNGYSGRPVFNFFFLNYFNVLFTSLIPFYVSLFDKDVSEDVLMQEPNRYKEARRYFNTKSIIYNISLALLKSGIIFWSVYFMFVKIDFTKGNGFIGGYAAMNNYFSLIVFSTILVRQIRMVGFYNIFFYISTAITIILYFVVIFGIQEFSEKTKNSSFHLFSMPVFYFSFMALFGIIIFIDFIYDITHKRLIQ
ncbi:phospholipid transporting ATPase [Conglomerata obtusa]